MSFASKKTKKAVLALLSPGLTSLGYQLHQQDPRTMQSEFRRELTDDVTVSLSVGFSDGPLSGASMTRVDAMLGIASNKLLAIYSKLHDASPTTDFFPIAGSMRQFTPPGREGSWFFDLPDRTADATAFLEAVRGPIEQLLGNYDTADKQVNRLLNEVGEGLSWNEAFFEPVSYIYLGDIPAAISAAEKVLARPASPAFTSAYRVFYEQVLRADA